MDITNIRYGIPGKILFDCKGKTISIREPMDVLLVNTGKDEAAANWIRDRYWYILMHLSEKGEERNENK